MENYETILVEKRDRVAVLTINRPDKLNALNSKVHIEGVETLEALRNDSDVRVVVIKGAGEKAFVAGADISEFADATPVEQRDVMNSRSLFTVLTYVSETGYRHDQRLLSGRRKRTGDGLRHPHSKRQIALRATGNKLGNQLRRRRHTASDQIDRRIKSDGNDSHGRYD